MLAGVGLNVSADSHEPPPPAGLEGFFCTYNSGKDRDDLDSATEFYLKQAEKAGITAPPSYVWTHLKGTAPVDFIWLSVHESLVAYGEFSDAGAASSEMAEVLDRYDTVATCQPNLAVGVPVIAPDPDADAPASATLATYACKIRGGGGTDVLGDLNGHIVDVNEAMGDAGLAAAFQLTPLTSDPQGPDVVLVAAAENTAAWTRYISGLNTSPGGQSLIRHFNAVLDCGMNLWISNQVIGGDG
jgi:hypothetical protein